MSKKGIAVSIDEELHKKAKDVQMNISGVVEDAIRKKLITDENTPVEMDVCGICGKHENKATAQSPIGLCWLSPDEIWICDKCLTIKKRKVGVRVA